MKTSEAGNRILPNTFQHPNFFVDELMYLLTPEENIVLTFAIRRILGFQDNITSRKDHISLSQFTGEIKNKSGEIVSYGCGLSVNAVRNALQTLEQYKILIPTTKTAGPNGQEYWLQINDNTIDTEGLLKRTTEKKEKNQKRVQKATEKSLKIRGIVARKGNVGRKGSVSSDDRAGVTSDDNTKPRETQGNPEENGVPSTPRVRTTPTRRTDAKVQGDLMDGILAFGAQGQALAEQTGIEAGVAQAILDYPVDVRSGVQMMYTHFGIKAIPEKPRSGRGGDYADWIAGVRELQGVAAAYGVTLEKAFQVTHAAWNESPFTASRPGALKKTMSSTLARLSAPSTESDQPQTWQQETWRNSVY